jgi:hypothetical protein
LHAKPIGVSADVVLVTYNTPGVSDNRLTFFFLRWPDGKVVVDDVQCTGGGASTSLYASLYGDPPVPCYQESTQATPLPAVPVG